MEVSSFVKLADKERYIKDSFKEIEMMDLVLQLNDQLKEME